MPRVHLKLKRKVSPFFWLLQKSGNEAFNSGRYTEAIENYTAAISKSFDSRAFMAVCFCNRAAAYQSLNQIVDAISDCSVAIALDENYPKVGANINLTNVL